MNIGIIGGGAIANFFMDEINHNKIPGLYVKSVFIRDFKKYNILQEKYGVELFVDVDRFLDSGIDIVVEAANIQAVKDLVPAILKKKDMVLISIGALADEALYKKVYSLAEAYDRSIYLPSGAIGGLDLVQHANALGGLTEVSLVTRKPADSLLDDQVNTEIVVFDGPASKAIEQYPKNINVSIILSLAGIGIERTNVKIIADPNIEKNIHMIDVSGEFGTASFSITNNPMEANPKTSYLAAMSALGTVKNIAKKIKIGN